MFERGKSATQKSRAPYLLVAAVCVVVTVAFLTRSQKPGSAGSDRPAAAAAGPDATAIGRPPALQDKRSIAARTSEMTAARKSRREQRRQKLKDARLTMAGRFNQEPVDPAWSAAKESSLQALAEGPTYREMGILPDSLQIDCRTSLCKVTANHASYGSSADWAMIFMTSAAGEIKRAYTNTISNPDGTTSVEIHAEAR